MNNFKVNRLCSMMAIASMAMLPVSMASYGSDLTIYKGSTTGKTSIFLMLDTSGSMGISSLVLPRNNQYGSPGDVDEPLCNKVDVLEGSTNIKEWAYNLLDNRPSSPTFNKASVYQSVTIGGEVIPYYIRGCTKNINGRVVSQYDRLSRLKSAILPLLASDQLKNDTIMGLGNFSSKTNLTVSGSTIKLVDGHSGTVLVPNAPLTVEQRKKIAKAIAQFQSLDTTTNQDGTSNNNLKLSSKTYPDVYKSSSGTPTAHAYAEAAAYMMGKGTGVDPTTDSLTRTSWVYDGYMVMQNNSTKEQVYFICVALGPTLTASAITAGGNDVKQCVNNWPGYDATNLTVASGTINDNNTNGGVLKPNGSGGWTKITTQAAFKADPAVRLMLNNSTGNMSGAWDVFSKLPIGWRYGGWMRVDNEPLDIEPVVGTVYGGYAGPSSGLVSYRTNPFSLVEQANSTSYTDNLVGGFKYSSADSKKTDGTSTYKQGGTTSECDGNGIYFLTDGAPNSTKDTMAQTIMNTTLTGPYAFSAKPSGAGVLVSPALKSNLFSGETGGWEYIGEYSKKLLDPTKNPAKMKIKTAVVGFGSSFEGLALKADGTYDCDTATATQDVKNACKWGSKGAGYGEGGFYQATNSTDIANSIVKFVNDVAVDFEPSSIGTISIPLDPLDQTKSMGTGFFPMVQPLTDTRKRTWLGNLKKYYVLNGTLSDSKTSGGNLLYKVVNNKQTVNPNAKDIWSNQDGDNSLIKVGGTWNQIPDPANFTVAENSVNNTASTRNVFVVSGSSLKLVTKTNLATDAAADQQIGTVAQFPVKQRLALLNYLGYESPLPSTLPTTLTAATINALPIPASPYRYLGGVIHSTPLVVTQSASIDAQDKVTDRKEYVVYGSMDGGLHVVDAASGLEKSVFVPDEILTNQPETLVNERAESATLGLAYGVDAPWVADNTFKVTTSSGTTKYIARNMNIYGGLRMGGNALYGLDISTPTAPSLKFKITPTTSGFSRLGQIWSKPVVANIRVKGKVEKVLIFGGGYDKTVFEDGTETVSPNGPTIGNALYIVKASNGELLWSVSSSNSGTTNASNQQKQADVKFSVVGQPAVRDYNADGLTDVIYFADLGGQIFRVDLNNAAQAKSDADANLAVRTQTLAQLKTDTFTPRFYERPSTAVFKEGQNRFVLVTLGSGNRSYPLVQEPGLNKVYGIIDYDAASQDLEKSTFTPSAVVLPTNLITTGILGKTFSAANSVDDVTALRNRTKKGWAFSLKSSADDGYVKAMEETQLINSDLYVSVYDPNALLGGGTANVCGGGVQGISTVHRVCMPYGNCAAYATTDNQGIIGVPLGPIDSDNSRKTQIVSPTAITAEKCVGEGCGVKDSEGNNKPFIYKQSRVIKPIRWYEW